MISEQDRLDAAFQYIASAQSLVETSSIAIAHTYWQYFFTRAAICMPGASTDQVNARILRIVDPAQRAQGLAVSPLVVLPLFEEDLELGPPLQNLWNSLERAAAQYLPLGNLMFFRACRSETPFICAATLLHEAGHAYRAALERRIGAPGTPGLTKVLLAEEVDMHTLNHQLWRERNPTLYDSMIDKGLYWLKKAFKQHGNDRVFYPLKSDGPWARDLDTLLGPAPNEIRRNARVFELSMYVSFAYADRQTWSQEHKQEYKMAQMRTVYTNFAPQVGQPIQ